MQPLLICYVVRSHSGFNLHFLTGNDSEHRVICFPAMLFSEVCVHASCPFLIGLFCFFTVELWQFQIQGGPDLSMQLNQWNPERLHGYAYKLTHNKVTTILYTYFWATLYILDASPLMDTCLSFIFMVFYKTISLWWTRNFTKTDLYFTTDSLRSTVLVSCVFLSLMI